MKIILRLSIFSTFFIFFSNISLSSEQKSLILKGHIPKNTRISLSSQNFLKKNYTNFTFELSSNEKQKGLKIEIRNNKMTKNFKIFQNRKKNVRMRSKSKKPTIITISAI